MNTKATTMMVLFALLPATGCATKYVNITSEPTGAKIWRGRSSTSLENWGVRTPYRAESTYIGSDWRDYYYQARKAGYHDSNLIFEPKGSGDGSMHFVLKPLPKRKPEQKPEPKPKVVTKPSPPAFQRQPKLVQRPQVAPRPEQKPKPAAKEADSAQAVWDRRYTQANVEALSKIEAYALNTATEEQLRDDGWPDAAASSGPIGILEMTEDGGATRYELGYLYDHQSGDPNGAKPATIPHVTVCTLTFSNGTLTAKLWDEAFVSRLAEMYRRGLGVTQDSKEVARWYGKAAEQGAAQAQLLLGLMYYKGDGVPKDFKKAAEWYTKAAKQGLAQAQLLLGLMYYKGQGVAKNAKEAAKWYAEAAKQGDAQAQLLLGLLYHKGEGVAQDFKNAAMWCAKAAAQGVPKAQAMIGLMYYGGQGVPKDYDQAAKWCMNAAVKGVAEAQAMIGAMYFGGQGVFQNDLEAYKWALLAIENGAAEAKDLKEMLEKKMTPAEIAEGKRRAGEFKVK